MPKHMRRIGTIGSASRLLVGSPFWRQIGFPTFTSIDELETRLAARTTRDAERSETLERPPEEGDGEGIGSFGRVQLAACLGAGGLAVLAIALVDWLT